MDCKKQKSRTNCCVVGCHNKYSNTTGVSFYKFPKIIWLAEKREKWIKAVKHVNMDKSDWKPSDYSRICSIHFVGGKKSENPLHPAYIPTLHLGQTRKSSQTTKRFERAVQRTANAD